MTRYRFARVLRWPALFLAFLACGQARAQDYGGYYPADTLRAPSGPTGLEDHAAPALPGPQLRTSALEPAATFEIRFSSGFPAEARRAFQYAADIWATHLTSPVPIVIQAEWSALGADVLGSAGPYLITGFPNQPTAFRQTWYPFALASAIAGQDLGRDDPDIDAFFTSERSDWYFGTDGNPAGNQFDFVTVVLHELGHGLGFVGSFDIEDPSTATGECAVPAAPGQGCWGQASSRGVYPFIFDRFTEDSRDNGLLNEDLYPNPSDRLADTLQSQRVFFDGTFGTAANLDVPIDLFAPATFEIGSSYSHLDEGTFSRGSANSLMTPSISRGEVIHSPGPLTCAIMQDLGWELGSGCLALLGQDPVTEEFEVTGPFPNPFAQRTTFTVGVEEAQEIRIDLYNVLGQRVSELYNGNLQGGLPRPFALEAAHLPSGLYVVHILGETFSTSLSVVHVR